MTMFKGLKDFLIKVFLSNILYHDYGLKDFLILNITSG